MRNVWIETDKNCYVYCLREEFEMKKLLVLTLVMAMASAASAGSAWFEVDPASYHECGYDAGDVIKINVIADFDVQFLSLAIGSNWGIATGAGPLNPIYQSGIEYVGNIINSGGALITHISAADWENAVPAGQIIYSFTFEMPDLPDSILVIIDSLNGGEELYYTSLSDGTTTVEDLEALVIHTPEPLTIALLGLGGLFLRRRK
jgi:hypothetical protein